MSSPSATGDVADGLDSFYSLHGYVLGALSRCLIVGYKELYVYLSYTVPLTYRGDKQNNRHYGTDHPTRHQRDRPSEGRRTWSASQHGGVP